jgi:hypothetical protein
VPPADSAGEIARIELGKALAEKIRVEARLAALPADADPAERAFLHELLAGAEARCRVLEAAVRAPSDRRNSSPRG